MGSWLLESVKMLAYIFYPVAGFYLLNQPEIYNTWVKEKEKISLHNTEVLGVLERIKQRNTKKNLEKVKGEITLL